jgi:hypothetical protein
MTRTEAVENPLMKEMLARRTATDAAHAKANREALLEHARMGRSVPEAGPNGTVVWVTPVEIFARYGLDEFGREKS